MSSKLAAFYSDKVVFSTGLTGCMGIVTAYMLLKKTNVRRVYALVRAEPGRAQERLEECLRTYAPTVAEAMIRDGRIVAVRGDITAGPLLGMDEKTVEHLRAECHVVLNMSADINLTKRASVLARTNVLGALAIAELATSFRKLERFAHVSTLYSQSHLGVFDEQIYPVLNAEEELEALLNGKSLVDLAPFIFDYAYTKNVTERLLVQRFPDLPLCIVRPSVFGPSLAEPTPLWVFTSSMASISFVALAAGQSKRQPMIHATSKEFLTNFFDEVPVDISVNVMPAHVAAGTKGPVHACSSSNPSTTLEMFGPNLDLLPPQIWSVGMPVSEMVGLPKLYKIIAAEHPRGSVRKTEDLISEMTAEDLAVFPIDLKRVDMRAYHRQKAGMVRSQLLQVKGISSGRIPVKL